jgi:hypothetical protein
MRRRPTHGTDSRYHSGCRCRPCRNAHADATRAANKDLQARYLAAGLTTSGRPRKRPYDERCLRLMAEFNLQPDPRFVWTPEDRA